MSEPEDWAKIFDEVEAEEPEWFVAYSGDLGDLSQRLWPDRSVAQPAHRLARLGHLIERPSGDQLRGAQATSARSPGF